MFSKTGSLSEQIPLRFLSVPQAPLEPNAPYSILTLPTQLPPNIPIPSTNSPIVPPPNSSSSPRAMADWLRNGHLAETLPIKFSPWGKLEWSLCVTKTLT